MYKPRILIMGVGNLLFRDEGVGVHLVNRMKNTGLPPHIDLLDAAVGGFELIDYMEGYDRIIIMDAMKGGKKPGEFIAFRPFDVSDVSLQSDNSLHRFGLLTVLKVAGCVGRQYDILIVGIEPASVEAGIGLSVEVEAGLSGVVNFITRTVNDYTAEMVNEQKNSDNR